MIFETEHAVNVIWRHRQLTTMDELPVRTQAPFVLRGQLPPGNPIIHCIICKSTNATVLWDSQGAIGREKQRGPASRQLIHCHYHSAKPEISTEIAA
jgi:hypothetical protein